MSDQITEVTSQSWGGRLMESIKGVLFGIVFVVGSVFLLWWNEGRAVVTAKSLAEGAAAVVSIAADAIDAAREGALVHLTGNATTDETISDPLLGVSTQAIALEREVAMYQWEESESSETRKKLGGGTETVTTYSYAKSWSERPISSSSFKEPTGHQNPGSFPFSSERFEASTVTLGAFELSRGLVGSMTRTEDVVLTELPPDLPAVGAGSWRLDAGGLYASSGGGEPQVGDLKVGFDAVPPATVSIVAQQRGDSFSPYQTEAGRALEFLSYGNVSAEAMFQAEVRKNTILTWVLRGVGFFVMAMGIGMVFRPIAVFGDVIPFVGSLLGMGIGLFAGIIAAAGSLLTIGMAWIFYRPVLGGLLVAAGVAAIVVPKLLSRGKGGGQAEAAA